MTCPLSHWWCVRKQPGSQRALLSSLGREQRPGMIPTPPPPLPRTCTPPSAQDNGNTVPQQRAGGQPPPAKAPAWRGEERMKYTEEGSRGSSWLSQEQQGPSREWGRRSVPAPPALWEGTLMAAAWAKGSPHPVLPASPSGMPKPLSPFVHCLQIPPPPVRQSTGWGHQWSSSPIRVTLSKPLCLSEFPHL